MCKGPEVQLSFLGGLWALSKRENAVGIYNGEVEGEEGTGIKKKTQTTHPAR